MSPSVEQQWVARRQEELEHHLRWAASLTKVEKKQLTDRAALLDSPGQRAAPEPKKLRVAFLASIPDGTAVPDPFYEDAFNLACAGHVVFLVSQFAPPGGLPADFSNRIHWVTVAPLQSPLETLPPVDLVVATAWEQLPALYRAGRSFTYLATGHDGRDQTRLNPLYYLLPTCLLVTAGEIQRSFMEQAGRQVIAIPGAGAGRTHALAEALIGAVAVAETDPFRRTRPRISLCMIARNESERIQRCILSAYGIVDEVCLIDTGSTDDTVERAEQVGARVETLAWQDDFSAPRNASLAMAAGDWILQLDADEELTLEARRALPELVRRSGVAGYLLPIDSVTPTGLSRNYGVRLFRRTRGIAYAGRVHENVAASMTDRNGRLESAQAPIRHYGYKEDPMLATGKRSRNRRLLLKAREEEPGNPWYQYYLAVEEYLSGEPEAALQLVRTLRPMRWIEGEPAFLETHTLHLMGRWREALAAARSGTQQYPHVLSLWSYQATIGYALGETEACRSALKVLHKPTQGTLGYPEMAAAMADYLEGCLAADPHTAAAHWAKAAPLHNAALRPLLRHRLRTTGLKQTLASLTEFSNRQPFDMLLQALVDLQDWEEAARLLEAVPHPETLPGMGSLLWAQGDVESALSLWQKAGGAGWMFYGIAAGFFGEASDLAQVLDHVTPLQALALQDLQQGKDSWRLALLVSHAMDLGNANMVQLLAQRAPFLAESMSGYYRLYIQP